MGSSGCENIWQENRSALGIHQNMQESGFTLLVITKLKKYGIWNMICLACTYEYLANANI